MNVLDSVDLTETKMKLYERLKPSGWGDKLKTFLLSDDFSKILLFLLKDAREGKRFTPVLKQVFRAFEECKYEDLKIIILGQDPFPQPLVADGIAFSCSNTRKPEASMRYMFQEIEHTVYKDGYGWDPDLKRWSNQGILLINTAFTTTIAKVGTHYDIWRPFMAFLLDTIAFQNPGLIYVFMGKKAQEWMTSIPDNNYLLTCMHPAAAAHSHSERWNSGDIFNRINELSKKQFGTEIVW